MAIRHQLAVYSPIPAAGPMYAAGAALRLARDPRPALIDLLRREYDASEVLLTGSGTQALQVAIVNAVRRARADRPAVALPAFSCFDVAAAAVGAMVSAALYDLDPETLGPDLGSLERVLASGVRVAVIAPLYGMPAEWDTIGELANRYDVILIEDSAQGHGAAWRAAPLGALGDISTLSFGRGKGWTAGCGGAVLARRGCSIDAAMLAPCAAGAEARTIAALAAQWTLGRPPVYGIPHSIPSLALGETVYHPPVPPAELPRAAAAAALHAFDASRAEAAHRRENAQWFLDRLAGNDRLRPIRALVDAAPGYLRLPIKFAGGIARMSRPERAIALGVAQSYPRSLVELAPNVTGPEKRWPGTDELVRDLVTLPVHSRLTPIERDEVVRMLQEKPR